MPLRYSGLTLINSTFVAATRAELVNGIKDALTAPADGFTVVSGSSGDWLLQSRATGQSLQFRVRIWDPGSGTTARIACRSVDGIINLDGAGTVALRPAGDTWRVIGNGYHVFVFTAGIGGVAKFGCFGTGYLESFNQSLITQAFYQHGNARGDNEDTVRMSFRTSLQSTQDCARAACVNGNYWSTNDSVQRVGELQFAVTVSSKIGTDAPNLGRRWHNGEFFVMDPLLMWGLGSHTNEPRVRIQLYDCAVFGETFNADDIDLAFDSHNWYAITGNNQGSGSTWTAGTLCHIRS